VTARAAAARYARALFDVAAAEGDPRQVETELAEIVALLGGHEALRVALTNPAVPTPAKRAVMRELAARASLSTPVTKLLALMAERDRLALLPDLLEAYRARLMEHLQIVRADVTTAVALPADRLAALERAFAEATGRTVTVAARVDPAIVGGVVARIGSTVYDGSIKRHLERIREQLYAD
jgi:F-type H+-transporting ATPase subunit delta